jgi:tetratricopeptide (TPR) repeat protein
MTNEPLDLELSFDRLRNGDEHLGKPDSATAEAEWELYDLGLIDHTRSTAYPNIDEIRFRPDEQIPGLGISARKFTSLFAAPGTLTLEDGLRFGAWLEELLFPTTTRSTRAEAEPLRNTWDRVVQAATESKTRPLRLQLSFPHSARGVLSTLPFELLARGGAFYFRRHGWSLVRCFRGMLGESCELGKGSRLGVIWANTVEPDKLPIPRDVFDKHEEIVSSAASRLQSKPIQPLRQATRKALLHHAAEHQLQGLDVVSIVAHGSAGRLWLHLPNHPSFPSDPGDPVSGEDFAQALKQTRVKAAFVWSCHAAQGHDVLGSVAHSLLSSGGLVAVVGAHAALRADTTPRIADELLKALATSAHGQLDRAVGEARRTVPEGDLQWAAPLYYARPLRGRSVTFVLPPDPEPVAGEWSVRNAPSLTPLFRGRDAAVSDGVALVVSARVVTLTGLPGAGKSELARAIADRLGGLASRPVERAEWISLVGVQRTAELRGRLVATMGLRDVDDDATLAQRLAKESLLFVFDNAEDLIHSDHAGFRGLVGSLLQSAAGLRFLFTSRRLFGDPLPSVPERDLVVDCLTPPDDRELFLAAGGVRITPEERTSDDLQAIIHSLGGHPRSLVLVAGQVGRGLSLKTIRRRLDTDKVDAVTAHELIGTDQRTGQEQEQRASRLVVSMNMALAALDEASQDAAELYRWLGLFPAGIPSVLLPLLFGESAEERLVVLLRHSMVVLTGPDRRLTLPAPLRWHARRRLDDMTEERRHELLSLSASAFAQWLGTHSEHHLGTDSTRRALRVAAEEIENLTALGDELFATAAIPASKTRLALAIRSWSRIQTFAGRGLDDDAKLVIGKRVSATLAVVSGWVAEMRSVSVPPEAAAILFQTQGDLQLHMDRLAAAEESYGAALPIYRQIEHRLDAANTLLSLGDLQRRTARLQEAEESYHAALPIFQKIEDRLGEANTLRSLGHLQSHTNRLREAEESYHAALPIYRQMEERVGEANTLLSLGDLQLRMHRLREAEASYHAALPIYRQMEDRLGEAHTLLSLGDLQLRMHRLREAEVSYHAALPIYHQMEHRLGEANTLRSLGNLQMRTDRLQEAEESYHAALPIYRQMEERVSEANTLLFLGDLQLRMHRLREAEESYHAAVPIFQKIEDRLGEANTLRSLGNLQMRTHRLREAEESYHAALPIYRQMEHRLGEANTLQSLGNLQMRTDRLQEAEESYHAALPIYRQMEERVGEANTILSLGDLQLRMHRLREAEESYHVALPIFQKFEDRLGEANTLRSLGHLLLRMHREREAEESFHAALPIYHQMQDRLGEANTLQSLGNLQMLTDRMQEAEESYRATLSIYRQMEERVGEANTLHGFGSLALAQHRPAVAFHCYRAALDIQRATHDSLGMGGSFGYLARAALAAGDTARSVVLGGTAWQSLRAIDDHFGQALALQEVFEALRARNNGPAALAALLLAWAERKVIDDPQAESLAQMLGNVIENFDAQVVAPSLFDHSRPVLEAAIRECAAELEAAGVDPLSPLADPESPPGLGATP